MIDSGCQVVGAAAGTQVHSDDVEPRGKSFVRGPKHVSGSARTFNSVPQDHGRMFGAVLLPSAMAEYFYIRRCIKQSLFVFNGTVPIGARPRIRGQRLGMSTREPGVGTERVIEKYSIGSRQKGPRFFQSRIRLP